MNYRHLSLLQFCVWFVQVVLLYLAGEDGEDDNPLPL